MGSSTRSVPRRRHSPSGEKPKAKKEVKSGAQEAKVRHQRAPGAGGGRTSRQRGQGDARAQGPVRSLAQSARRADGHQRRRDHRREDTSGGHFENQAAQLVKEVAFKTNDVAGDGTTTALVLAQAIVHEGLKNVAAGANPVILRSGIEKAVEAAVEAIKVQAEEISGGRSREGRRHQCALGGDRQRHRRGDRQGRQGRRGQRRGGTDPRDGAGVP